MIFTVNSGSSVGIAGFARDSGRAAIDKALELLRDGEKDVAITAPDGEVYAHDRLEEFALRYELKKTDQT
jgi:hypothetical protein